VKPDRPLKHFILAFLLALVGYIVCYYWIEHRRTRNGPWQVTFTRTTAGDPVIVIDHPGLAVTNVQLRFTGSRSSLSTNTTTLLFARPEDVPCDLPFGKCVFMDTTFLPGTVTLQLFGHEIELLPRTLVLDHEEYPWHSDATITLTPARAAPAPALPSSQ